MMLRVVALLLAAATAYGKDTDGGECQGLMQCALNAAHEKLDAFNTGCANDAAETSAAVFGETVGRAVGDEIPRVTAELVEARSFSVDTAKQILDRLRDAS